MLHRAEGENTSWLQPPVVKYDVCRIRSSFEIHPQAMHLGVQWSMLQTAVISQ